MFFSWRPLRTIEIIRWKDVGQTYKDLNIIPLNFFVLPFVEMKSNENERTNKEKEIVGKKQNTEEMITEWVDISRRESVLYLIFLYDYS